MRLEYVLREPDKQVLESVFERDCDSKRDLPVRTAISFAALSLLLNQI